MVKIKEDQCFCGKQPCECIVYYMCSFGCSSRAYNLDCPIHNLSLKSTTTLRDDYKVYSDGEWKGTTNCDHSDPGWKGKYSD